MLSALHMNEVVFARLVEEGLRHLCTVSHIYMRIHCKAMLCQKELFMSQEYHSVIFNFHPKSAQSKLDRRPHRQRHPAWPHTVHVP